MSEGGWIASGLVSLVIVLLGLVISDHHRRLTNVEDNASDHDKWAAVKAEELATLREAVRTILDQFTKLENAVHARFDRLDGRIDHLETKIDRTGH